MGIFNSRVLVQDEGYVKINSAQNLNVWDGDKFVNISEPKSEQLVTLELWGGNHIVCSHDTKFFSKMRKQWIKAKDLKSTYVLMGSSALPDFEYMDLSSYTHLKNLNSYNAGLLAGLSKIFAHKNVYRLHFHKTKLRELLEQLLLSADVPFIKIETEKTARPQVTYTLNDNQLGLECETLIGKNGFNSQTWKSKLFIKGFLEILIEFAEVQNNQLSFRFNSNLSKDVHDALIMFGVNSYLTRGVMTDFVTIPKEYFPMVAKNIGAINLGKTLKLYNNNFFTKAMSKKPLTFRILDVTISDKYIEMFGADTKLVSNGLIIT